MAISAHMLGRTFKNVYKKHHLWFDKTNPCFVRIWHKHYLQCDSLSSLTPSAVSRISHCLCSQGRKVPVTPPICTGGFASVSHYSTKQEPGSILAGKYIREQNEDSSSSKESETGENEEASSKKKQQQILGIDLWKWGIIFFTISVIPPLHYLYFDIGAGEKDEEGNEIPDAYSDLPWWKAHFWRAYEFLVRTKKEIEEPSYQKLLPDPLKEPYYQPPYTVVIELVDVLVHPDWKWSTGWRFKKRPGVEYFLQTCGYPRFEMVIYTKEAGMTAFPVIDQLDQQGHISFRLFRDATRYEKGVHKKDINCLNRDPSKIILVDCDAAAVGLSPRNAVLLKKWNGEDEDKSLYDLASLLSVIGASGVEDVRTVLDSYHNTGGDMLEQFKERQRAYLELQEQMKQTKQDAQSKSPLLTKYSASFRR